MVETATSSALALQALAEGMGRENGMLDGLLYNIIRHHHQTGSPYPAGQQLVSHHNVSCLQTVVRNFSAII